MNVLIIGSGGREHALGWKLQQSPKAKRIYFAPGNAGTSLIGTNIDIPVEEINELAQWAEKNTIDLTVVGPEMPLALGIVDVFNEKNLKIFGPNKIAAQLETSKSYSASFMDECNIPQPASAIFTTPTAAKKYILEASFEVVVKASGLAAGKGVLVPANKEEAIEAVDTVYNDFGDAGKEIVIQEKLSGPEVSLLAITDGKTIIPFIPAQDHKRIFDNDTGPNTGGMGAYAPVPFVTAEMINIITKTILQPVIDGMNKRGNPYTGILYAGLMMTKNGPKVLEFNARFGDPETQPLMMLLDSDLFDLLYACTEENLNEDILKFKQGGAACIVLASKGYPETYTKGDIIHGLNHIANRDVCIFHSGTQTDPKGNVVTNGGRVLGVTAFGNNMQMALDNAYSVIGDHGVYFNGMHYRTDIGKKK